MKTQKRSLRRQLPRLSGLFILGAALSACQEPPKLRPAPDVPVVGGYQTVDISNADLASVRALAIAELQRLHPTDEPFELKTAESQVVAGTNFRLHLTGRSKNYEVVVFRDLQGQRSISSVLIDGH